MSQPKFSVGEEVILQSKDCSKYNGDYIISGIIYDGVLYNCRITGLPYKSSGFNWGYILSVARQDPEDPFGREIVWGETALRKKHKPSEFKDFTSLMDSLKLPQKVS